MTPSGDDQQPATEPDVTSDPAMDDAGDDSTAGADESSDWSGEGGAVADGPATDTDDAQPGDS